MRASLSAISYSITAVKEAASGYMVMLFVRGFPLGAEHE
jgi:hypothetical protein